MKLHQFPNFRLPIKHDRDVELQHLSTEHPLAITPEQQQQMDAVVANGFFPNPATLNDAVALRTNDLPWLVGELYRQLQASGQTLPLPIVTAYVRESVFFKAGCQHYQKRLIAGLVRAGYEPSVIKSTLAVSRIKPELVDLVADLVTTQDQITSAPQRSTPDREF